MTDLQSNAKVLQVEGWVSRFLAYLISLPPFFRLVACVGIGVVLVAGGWVVRGIL